MNGTRFDIIKKGSITTVPGFYAGSSHCGLKNSDEKLDITIIYIPDGSACSGVFTTNSFQAAPVVVDREILRKKGMVKAVVINSGIANACTGKQGMENAVNMQEIAGSTLGTARDEVMVASTGVIGKQLPMDKIEKGIRDCAQKMDPCGGEDAAAAILTTDLVKKNIAVSVPMEGGNSITIGGIAKGSGMIEPNMATMLAFVGTDAKVDKGVLQKVLEAANEESFNSISVDGCQSTNDTVLLMSNGKSGIEVKEKGKNYSYFFEGLLYVMKELARMIVLDGEGATKFIQIHVKGAPDYAQAKRAALKIANSNLFKTAIFGQDLNWGRINAALGSAGCQFDPENVDIYIDKIKIVEKGRGTDRGEKEASGLLEERDICFTIDLKNGNGCSTIWTSDLSFDYIKINALYHN